MLKMFRPDRFFIAMLALAFVSLLSSLASCDGRSYLNSWAVEIPGGLLVAREVAKRHGFFLVTQVSVISLRRQQKVPRRSRPLG